jgi:hypothetical protein
MWSRTRSRSMHVARLANWASLQHPTRRTRTRTQGRVGSCRQGRGQGARAGQGAKEEPGPRGAGKKTQTGYSGSDPLLWLRSGGESQSRLTSSGKIPAPCLFGLLRSSLPLSPCHARPMQPDIWELGHKVIHGEYLVKRPPRPPETRCQLPALHGRQRSLQQSVIWSPIKRLDTSSDLAAVDA